MRRLPVYFLIDVSESMAGAPIEQVTEGMGNIIRELRTDPYALETVFIAVLIFAGKAENLVPLVELTSFYPPSFPVGSGTSLGAGLDCLMRDMEKSVRKTTREVKGDWKPLVFLFTDGVPTDNAASAIKSWNRDWRNKCNLVAVSLGNNADVKLLCQLTDNVFRLPDLDAESIKAFFQWISASVKQSSISVNEQNSDALNLPHINRINLEKVDANSTFNVDENFAVLSGKCSKNQKLYLLKYAKGADNQYQLVGAYPIDGDAYTRLSGNVKNKKNVSSQNLIGQPACPCCGAQDALLYCGACGQIFCDGHKKDILECPWCGNSGRLTYLDNINYGRERG